MFWGDVASGNNAFTIPDLKEYMVKGQWFSRYEVKADPLEFFILVSSFFHNSWFVGRGNRNLPKAVIVLKENQMVLLKNQAGWGKSSCQDVQCNSTGQRIKWLPWQKICPRMNKIEDLNLCMLI